MDVLEAIRRRKSVRAYKATPIPDETLHQVLEAARLAPSAGNLQPWHFVVVRDKDARNKIARGCKFGKFLADSPVVIVACGDSEASPRWYAIETCIALENLVIAATALGLGTCWIGLFKEEEIKAMLELPFHLEVVALLALGFPGEKTDLGARLLHYVRPRKRLEEIVSLEKYGKGLR